MDWNVRMHGLNACVERNPCMHVTFEFVIANRHCMHIHDSKAPAFMQIGISCLQHMHKCNVRWKTYADCARAWLAAPNVLRISTSDYPGLDCICRRCEVWRVSLSTRCPGVPTPPPGGSLLGEVLL